MNLTGRLSLSLIINTIIGLFGYLLRFFAISRLETSLYASLSYFGIVMVFIYGIIFNGETIKIKNLFGALLIILSNLLLL
jgi:drug/metabolite transporter (DMT)-like permease